jgi:hypothetical protein
MMKIFYCFIANWAWLGRLLIFGLVLDLVQYIRLGIDCLIKIIPVGQIKNDIWISDWLSLMKACVLWCVFSSGISDHLVWAGQC